MSEFNTRKDRDQRGKAKPHYRLGYRTKKGIKLIAFVMHYNDEPLPRCNHSKSPGWWNRLFSTAPRRTADRKNIQAIMHGMEPDGISWHTHKKPVSYYL